VKKIVHIPNLPKWEVTIFDKVGRISKILRKSQENPEVHSLGIKERIEFKVLQRHFEKGKLSGLGAISQMGRWIFAQIQNIRKNLKL